MFDFDIIPNGVFVGSDGVIRMIKSNFSVDNAEHTQAVEKLISGDVEKVIFENSSKHAEQPSLEKQLAHTKYKLALEYTKQNKKAVALKELNEALRLDPENYIIRKQRWYIQYPDKFHPEIDYDWQKKQFKQEKEDEANDGKCGPDGCKLPRR